MKDFATSSLFPKRHAYRLISDKSVFQNDPDEFEKTMKEIGFLYDKMENIDKEYVMMRRAYSTGFREIRELLKQVP